MTSIQRNKQIKWLFMNTYEGVFPLNKIKRHSRLLLTNEMEFEYQLRCRSSWSQGFDVGANRVKILRRAPKKSDYFTVVWFEREGCSDLCTVRSICLSVRFERERSDAHIMLQLSDMSRDRPHIFVRIVQRNGLLQKIMSKGTDAS